MATHEQWYVYMLRCADTYIYTGISKDVKQRVLKHRSGKGAKFTKNKYPITLVYVRRQENLREALLTERAIKKFPKAKKEALIMQFQMEIQDRIIAEFLSVNHM